MPWPDHLFFLTPDFKVAVIKCCFRKPSFHPDMRANYQLPFIPKDLEKMMVTQLLFNDTYYQVVSSSKSKSKHPEQKKTQKGRRDRYTQEGMGWLGTGETHEGHQVHERAMMKQQQTDLKGTVWDASVCFRSSQHTNCACWSFWCSSQGFWQ